MIFIEISCKHLNSSKLHSVLFAALLTDFQISATSNSFIFPPDYTDYSCISSAFNSELSFILNEEQINKEDKVLAILVFGSETPNSTIEDMKIIGLCKIVLPFLSIFGPNEGWYNIYSYSECISQRKLDTKCILNYFYIYYSASIGQLKVTIYPAEMLSLLTNHGFKSFGSIENDIFMLPKSSCDDDEWFKLMNLHFDGSCNIPKYLLKKVSNSKRTIMPNSKLGQEELNSNLTNSKSADFIFNNYLNELISHDAF